MKHILTTFLLFTLTGSLSARPIAHYLGDFTPSKPKPGWRYEWNPSGVEFSDYTRCVSLIPLGNWCLQTGEVMTYKERKLGDGQWLRLTNEGFWNAGLTHEKSSDALDHFVIVSYTLQGGMCGMGRISESYLRRTERWGASQLSVQVNHKVIYSVVAPFSGLKNFDIPLGYLNKGDTVSVAFGPGENSIGAQIDFKIELVPPQK